MNVTAEEVYLALRLIRHGVNPLKPFKRVRNEVIKFCIDKGLIKSGGYYLTIKGYGQQKQYALEKGHIP